MDTSMASVELVRRKRRIAQLEAKLERTERMLSGLCALGVRARDGSGVNVGKLLAAFAEPTLQAWWAAHAD